MATIDLTREDEAPAPAVTDLTQDSDDEPPAKRAKAATLQLRTRPDQLPALTCWSRNTIMNRSSRAITTVSGQSQRAQQQQRQQRKRGGVNKFFPRPSARINKNMKR